MRYFAIAFLLVAFAASASAQERRTAHATGPKKVPRWLSAADVQRTLAASNARLMSCLRPIARAHPRVADRMRVDVVIAASGKVKEVALSAERVPARALQQGQRCVDDIVRGVRFPRRRFVTKAQMPFLLLKTAARGAGPRPGCYRKDGCPSKR
jgi:hypothetical protein